EQFGKLDTTDTRYAVFGAVLLLFLGATIFTPVVARPLVSLLGFLFSWSLPGKLGRRNSGRNPRRTAITATALMIGITLVTGVGVLFSSANASIQKYMSEQVKMDLMISSVAQGENPTTFDKKLIDDTAEVDGVDKVVESYMDYQTTLDGEDIVPQATSDVKGLTNLLGVTEVSGDMDSLGPDELLLSKAKAKETHKEVGDTVEITFPKADGPKEFTISGIVDTGDMAAPWIIDASNAKDFFADAPSQAYVELDDKDDAKAVMKDINDLMGDDYPLVTVTDTSAFTEQLNQMFDIMLTVVQVLLGLAMLIAVIGVVNTLTLSIRERTRELGLLRATGLTRGQVTRMVTVESIVISLFGALLGLGVGAGLGIAVQRLLTDFMDVLAMPWGTMVFYVVAAVVVGFFAALIPAYRANRINVLDAISYE
ncbi:MAG: FtsX-like permease family protein, partial [Stackebrandtia sp.]